MRIYVAHSRSFNYKNELYLPLRSSSIFKGHNLILPHENSDEPFSSKEFFRNNCDLLIAEVSYYSTGLGIEVGWADAFGVPIVFVHKKDRVPVKSLESVSKEFIEYNNNDELIRGIEVAIASRE